MSRINEYRTWLRELTDWKEFIRRDSGLPGPRANLELLAAVVEEGGERDFLEYLELIDESLEGDSPDVLVAACGVAGLGKLIARNQAGRRKYLPRLRELASDPRWRIREAVAMALQRWGRKDMSALLAEMRIWSGGGLLERRAAAAGLCEPDLLADPSAAEEVLVILDEITASISADPAAAPSGAETVFSAAFQSERETASAVAPGADAATAPASDRTQAREEDGQVVPATGGSAKQGDDRRGVRSDDRAHPAETEGPTTVQRHSEDLKVLRKALSYGWSVAVAAHPEAGKPYLEKWAGSPDPDVRRIVRENLKKNRLIRMDAAWTRSLLKRLQV